ncbi:DNA repair protein SWI5 homolog isoform X1 [Brachionichthys hirsutus]|uniref:DNA repair protein SWI5 homolog isoform X1 n=1 Tax=Brachionichthys hirsutus TaxID=412623 RepID=UPI00360492FE
MSIKQSAGIHSGVNSCPASSSVFEQISRTPEGKDAKKRDMKRTPFSKKVHSNFKSPLQVLQSAKVSPEEEAAELERRRERLDAEIAQLEAECVCVSLRGYRVEELELHIDMLHEYNDLKDTGQSLLGRLAALRGATTRDLYSHFGLELDD